MYQAGDRIELIRMDNDPNPIAPGTRGVIDFVNVMHDMTQIGVQWANGRKLMLVLPDDIIKKI